MNDLEMFAKKLNEGFDGYYMYSDESNGEHRITLYYKNRASAETAHGALADILDSPPTEEKTDVLADPA